MNEKTLAKVVIPVLGIGSGLAAQSALADDIQDFCWLNGDHGNGIGDGGDDYITCATYGGPNNGETALENNLDLAESYIGMNSFYSFVEMSIDSAGWGPNGYYYCVWFDARHGGSSYGTVQACYLEGSN